MNSEATTLPDLDTCLMRFEAAYARQTLEPVRAAPLASKLALGIEQALMAQFLGADLGRYYGGTSADQIIFQLSAQLWRREQFPELGIGLTKSVMPDVGVALPATVLGVPWTPRPGQEPWASGEPPITSTEDLEGRPLPDFYTAGMMPLIIARRQEMQSILGGGYAVGTPPWVRGPLGNAFYLAGAERTLMALYSDQTFFHRLMRYGLEAMAKWMRQRAEYLGVPLAASAAASTLWNDEVSAENFSPAVYRAMIGPYDREFHDLLGGNIVFHSCGRTTPLMGEIANVAPWTCFHVSAWSDVDEALRVFPDTPLLVCLHPYHDMLGATPERTATRVHEIAHKCAGHEYTLCLTELLPVNGPHEDLRRIKDALAICADILLVP